MRYLGGKGRLGPRIAAAILATTPRRGSYLEPFLGGGNSFKAIAPHFAQRFAGEVHEDLVLMWQAAAQGWVPPSTVSEEMYRALKVAPPSPLRAFVGFACSFAGLWFQAPARDVRGVGLDHHNTAEIQSRVVAKTGEAMRGAHIARCSYDAWTPMVERMAREITIYCDPPYAQTATYDGTASFDSERFWQTLDYWFSLGAHIYVSEYGAPSHWNVLGTTDHLCAVAGGGKGVNRVEKLFARHCGEPQPLVIDVSRFRSGVRV